MSDPVSRRPSATEPAVGETRSAGPLPAGLPAQDAGASYSPIEREIERSERASAALAATRALARAAFTDSQLAAEDAVAAEDADAAAGWVRTEYAEFDHSVPADEDAAFDRPRPAGAGFDPGIASQQGRVFPGAAMADASLRTRTGAQARFRQDSRHSPRSQHAGGPAVRHELAPGGVGHDRLAVTALPASASASPARPDARQPRAGASARSQGRGGARFLLAAGLGGVVVLAAGGGAWKAGLLSRNSGPGSTAAPAQVEAARGLAPAGQEISIAPAAGALPPRGDAAADVAAQAAEARAAAVPTDAVHEPAPEPAPVSTPAMHPQAAASTTIAAPAPLPHRKVDVAAAIAEAQAKAERFLAPGGGAASTPPAGEGRQAP